jgi:hypothetical protein
MPDDKKRENRRRVGKVKAVRAMTNAKNNILDQPVPTPMGEPHRIVEPLNPEEERVLRLLRVTKTLPANTSAANLTALQALRDRGIAEWHEADRKWRMRANPVVKVLEAIAALKADEIDFLFSMLDSGMWDEWDTSLIGGIECGMGGDEIRIAASAGASTAKYIIEHP